MKSVKLILRNVNVLNILLLVTAIFLFFEFDYPLLSRQISVEQIEAKEVAIQNEERVAPESSASYADFVSIAEKNLFHPEREMPKAEKAAVPKPELILYGTLITDDVSVAYVEDKKSPYSTPGRAKRQTALKKGGSIGGYVLREIEPNRIVLVRGEDRLVVMLDETGKRMGDEKAASPPFKGPTGGFPPASTPPAGPQVQVMAPPPAAAPPSRPVISPTSAPPRGQTAEMIRNSKMQQREVAPQ